MESHTQWYVYSLNLKIRYSLCDVRMWLGICQITINSFRTVMCDKSIQLKKIYVSHEICFLPTLLRYEMSNRRPVPLILLINIPEETTSRLSFVARD